VDTQAGNLSTGERALSALLGFALAMVAVRTRSRSAQIATSTTGLGLLMRAAAGHCAVKSAWMGHSSLAEGARDQWCRLVRTRSAMRDGVPGSPLHMQKSDAVDEAVSESFPASDPPASRLPDEPPVNAEAKWEAARRAGGQYSDHDSGQYSDQYTGHKE
jgi:hypothetical protein